MDDCLCMDSVLDAVFGVAFIHQTVDDELSLLGVFHTSTEYICYIKVSVGVQSYASTGGVIGRGLCRDGEIIASEPSQSGRWNVDNSGEPFPLIA